MPQAHSWVGTIAGCQPAVCRQFNRRLRSCVQRALCLWQAGSNRPPSIAPRGRSAKVNVRWRTVAWPDVAERLRSAGSVQGHERDLWGKGDSNAGCLSDVRIMCIEITSSTHRDLNRSGRARGAQTRDDPAVLSRSETRPRLADRPVAILLPPHPDGAHRFAARSRRIRTALSAGRCSATQSCRISIRP